MKRLLLSFACFAAAAPAVFSAVNMSPLASFRGDGWFAPGEGGYGFLGTVNNERGIAYNPASGNLLLLSRTGGVSARVLNGLTGVETGTLAGAATLTGGTFAASMISTTSAGVIYVANLTTAVATPFMVYRWASEGAAAPTTALTFTGAFPRLGDTFDVTGSGTGTLLAAGYSGTGGNGFLTASTADGTTFTGTSVSAAGTVDGDFRLGLTFVDSNTLIGNQSAATTRLVDFAGTVGAPLTTISLSGLQRPMDYAIIGGVPYLAALDTGTSLVQIYNMANPAAPLSVATGNATSGVLTANANAAGSVKWGAIAGNTAILYAMSTNQGIQAFTVVVPEPATFAFSALGLLGILRRRR